MKKMHAVRLCFPCDDIVNTWNELLVSNRYSHVKFAVWLLRNQRFCVGV